MRLAIDVVPLAVGCASGLYTCAWGAYKDGRFEGFRRSTFLRSVWFSVCVVSVLSLLPGFRRELSPFHLFFLVMGIERLLTEIYKGCFRAERDGDLFAIPQPLTALGRPIQHRVTRIGLGVVGLVALALVLTLDAEVASLPAMTAVAFTAGLAVSVGGAYKDAPFEGFQPLKFFRSSAVLVVTAPLMWLLGSLPLGVLLVTFGGVERLIVEYYKSFIVRSVPGKFRADLPVIGGPYLRHRESLRHLAGSMVVVALLLYITSAR